MVKVLLFCLVCVCTLSLYGGDISLTKLNNVPGASVSAVTQLPNGDVLIGTPYGLWRTTDKFDTWTKINTKSFRDSMITRMETTVSGNVLVGTRNGLYFSADNGNTWSEKSTSFTDKDIKYMYSHNNGTVLVGVYKNLYRSVDNGITWSVFADTLFKKPYGEPIFHIGAGIITKNGTYLARQYRSTNGTSFNLMNYEVAATTNYAIDTATNIVCAWSDMFTFTTTASRFFAITPDNGTTWIYKQRTRPHNLHSLQIFNDNKQFTQISSVLPLGDNTFLHSIFGVGNYAYKIVKNTSNQYSIDDITLNSTGLNSQYILCYYRLKNGDIVAGTHGAGMFVSKDNAATWKQAEMNFNNPVVTAMTADKKNDNFYVTTLNGVYVTDNGGNTWTSLGFPENDNTILQIVALPKGGIVIRTPRNIYRYLFNQKTWFTADGNLKLPYKCTGLGLRGNSLYITLNDNGWYVSDNEGNTWNKLTGVSQYMFEMAEVPKSDNTLTIIGVAKEMRICFQKDLLASWFQRVDGLNKDAATFSIFSNSVSETFVCAQDGIYIYDFILQVWRNTENKDIKGKTVYSACSDPIGNIYAASELGLLAYDKKKIDWEQTFFNGTKYNIIASDNQGNIYCSALFGGLYKSSEPTIILGTPEQTLPADGATDIAYTNTPFQWKTVANADRFYLQVSKTPDFKEIVVKDSNITALTFSAKNLDYYRTYYWRVKAYRGTIASEWSPVRSFLTKALLPAKLSLVSPKNAATAQEKELVLTWNKVNEADTFHVQLSTKDDFSVIINEDSTSINTKKGISNLSEGTEYFWRVRGKNRSGYGTWSDTWSFTTKEATNSVREGMENEFNATVNNGILRIENNPYYNREITLTISDLTGKRMMALPLEKGSQTKEINISSLHSGYYLIMLESSTGSISKSIIVP